MESNNNFPKEFFYGYFHLAEKGYDVQILEESEIENLKKESLISKIINLFSNSTLGFPILKIFYLINKKNINLFDNSKLLIATTSSIGLSLGFLKRFGLIKKPIIFIVMGLLPNRHNFIKKIVFNFLLRDVEIVCISKNEKKFLENNFRQKEILYIPFGVDKEFWTPEINSSFVQKYILAIGNDNARDWDILVNAWEADFPELKIVTNLKIKTTKKNISIVKGNWGKEYLTDQQIKNFYLNSQYVIIPLKETIQPSGQSCCLQAMACGKPVIMTRISGLWDEKHLLHKKNIFLVEPNSILSLKESIMELNRDKRLYKKLSSNGRLLVEQIFNNHIMSKNIQSKIEYIINK